MFFATGVANASSTRIDSEGEVLKLDLLLPQPTDRGNFIHHEVGKWSVGKVVVFSYPSQHEVVSFTPQSRGK